MNDLALRLIALDPEASVAVRVISHFDVLVASRAGLTAIVAKVATLSGHPARLVDPARRRTVRMLADGTVAPTAAEVDPSWPAAPVTPDGVVLCIETTAPAGTVESVILERAAAAARAVLDRTRALPDPALLDVVLDADAPVADRLAAARRLRLSQRSRAVALAGGTALVVPADGGPPPGRRAGVGPAVSVEALPASWSAARRALRLTAEGTEQDPGPRVVRSDDLGILALVVDLADGRPESVPDLRALHRAATAAPWALATLEAVASGASLRDAARTLRVHHSTLGDRIAHLEAALGWQIRDPHGRVRLHLALALRRATR